MSRPDNWVDAYPELYEEPIKYMGTLEEAPPEIKEELEQIAEDKLLADSEDLPKDNYHDR